MAHNIVYYDSGTNSVIKMTTSDVDSLANYVLEYMVGLEDSAAAYINTTGAGNPKVSIGTINDYSRIAGSTDTSIQNTSRTFYQTQTQINSTYSPTIVGLDVSSPSVTVLQSNLMTLSDLADEIISRMNGGTYGGIGSYWFSVNAPSDGGTWVKAVADVTDTANYNGTTVQNYSLWRKVSNGTSTPLNKRPLKLDGSNNLTAFTTTEVQRILAAVEARMVSTSKGFYSIDATVPPSGTWVQAGDGFVDTVLSITSISYESITNYEAVVPDSAYYISDLFYDTTLYYDSVGTTTYIGPTTFYDSAAAYTGVNPDFLSFTSTLSFFGPATYTGTNPDGAGFVGPNIAFSGPQSYISVNPDGQGFVSPIAYFTGPAITYTGTNPDGTSFTSPATFFTGPGTVYTGTNPDGTSFAGSAGFTGPAPSYVGPGPGIGYVGPAGTFFGPGTATYAAPATTYIGSGPSYLGPANAFFTGPGITYTGGQITYLGPANTFFTGPGIAYQGGSITYLGPANAFFAGTASFFGPGPTYLGPTTAYFAGTASYVGPGPTYLGPSTAYFTGIQSFTASSYDGPMPQSFTIPASYTLSNTYVGPQTSLYEGPIQYDSAIVSNFASEFAEASGYSRKYFWRRIA